MENWKSQQDLYEFQHHQRVLIRQVLDDALLVWSITVHVPSVVLHSFSLISITPCFQHLMFSVLGVGWWCYSQEGLSNSFDLCGECCKESWCGKIPKDPNH